MRASSLLPLLAASPLVAGAPEGRRAAQNSMAQFKTDLANKNAAESIWDKIKTGTTCLGCQGILLLLKGIAAVGDDAFVKSAKALCKISKVQDADVCDGLIELEGPTVARAIRDMKLYSRTARTFCGGIVGLCKIPDTKGDGPKLPPMPDIEDHGRPGFSGEKPIHVVHFSDIHVDHQYTVGSNTQCNKPICCRPYTADDAPGTTKNPAGAFGDHMCDTPVSLEQSMYDAIKELVPDVEFALFTGDIVDHTIWNTSIASNTAEINHAMTMMDKHLNTVYGTIGNHEQHPANLIPPAGLVGSSTDWLYSLMEGAWSKWVPDDDERTIRRIGAYAQKHQGKNLRVISLNTNLYYRHNFELYRTNMESDPSGQLAWLAKQLEYAERAGDRVYILGHMPMGDADALHDGSRNFDTIVNRFQKTIAAMFWGHTHVDHFEVHYSDWSKRRADRASAIGYIAPSLTPTSGMPSFRVYSVDPITWAVVDVVQYAADMDDPDYDTKGPKWKKYYSAKETYGPLVDPSYADSPEELTPAFWHNVTEALHRDQREFDDFMERKSRGWKSVDCDAACRDKEICALRGGRAENNCDVPTPGLHFTRRDLSPDEHQDECGTSAAAVAFSELAVSKEAIELLQDLFFEVGGNMQVVEEINSIWDEDASEAADVPIDDM